MEVMVITFDTPSLPFFEPDPPPGSSCFVSEMEEDGAQVFRKDLDRIARAAQLCQTISSNILNFAREQEVATMPCDLRQVVEAALQIYEPLLIETRQQSIGNFGNFFAAEYADEMVDVGPLDEECRLLALGQAA